MELSENMLTSSDDIISQIEGLKWLPWIGVNYHNSKIMVLGESHYEDGDNWQENNIDTTRTMIGVRFNGHRGKLYSIVEKVLLSSESPTQAEGHDLWKSVVYYNLVQRLMSSIKERPSVEDFDKGWDTFFKLIEIIKPRYCIVLGKASCGRLGYYLNNVETGWERNIPEFYAKEKIINLIKNGNKLKLIFINHPTGSRGFNFNYWANLINEDSPELSIVLSNNVCK